MCGITGWIDWNQDLRHANKTVHKMAQTLNKRGPDALEIWTSTHAAFGHTRLIVVDPEGGRQPMTKEKDGSQYTLVYNGELYNTEDIRKELLQRGYRFKSHSDTEVLLTSYIEWKEQCVEHLNGIFAFAVWDEANQQIFMARDRLGVKPFFYRDSGGSLLFGSELKAILAHPNVKCEVDSEGMSEVLGLGPSRSPGHGVFKGIKELRPGHCMKLTRSGLKVWRYWNVKSNEHTDTFDETVANVRSLFLDTVERQLVSDVPLCTFLSGGLDSSAITARAANVYANVGNEQLHTFSIDYVDNEKYFKATEFQPNSDKHYIEVMSDTFNTVHHRCVIGTEELTDLLKEAVITRDLPGMADVDSSLLWFCRQIKKHATVSLSGECADEIFGGYPWFHRKEDLEREGFPWMRSMNERISLLDSHWQQKLDLKGYVKDRYDETISEMPRLDGESIEERQRRELFYINMLWFMTTLLDRKDRMSMGASLEVRVPFADHRLVEYVWNIPWEMKMHGDREKGLLRKALEGLLPNEILYRKKSPYPKTHNPNYTVAVQGWMNEILSNKNAPLFEFFEYEKIKELSDSAGESFQTPFFGQLMTGPQLIAYLAQTNYWLEQYNVNIVQ
ncbi:asparagine synthase (glutamine-hydrolyzing) [Bacillus solimangrovi]|uniref:asparagine synthase (glutamine-hydrolyzing) n=1 Tax=Bacillus solimangrovi TaxID=1305675 RepID=A0A1E5LC41_9BACI|nr:asparagine synthase (glutamine-hydrolyzing) [Bacillus solimangrovi]OEH91664.1 asparagine synthase (glutamine-hydrolyzing) [Bacillus solimangrovi]